MKRSELAFTALLVPLDALMLFLAFLAAYYLRDNVTLLSPDVIGGLSSRIQYNPASTIQPYAQYLHYVAYLVPGMVAIFALTGLYSLTRTASFWQRLGKVALGVSVGLFFILLLFLFKRDFFLPRTTVLYSWLFGIVFVMAGRALIRLIQQALYRLGTGVVRVGVVGNNEAAKTLMKQLTKGWSAQYSLVKIEEDDVDGLLPHITRDQIDELIIVNEKFTVENLITLRNRCLEQHVGFGFLPRALTALQGADYTIHEELGIPVIEVKPTPLDGWGRIAKRTFDIVVSTLLIIIASPFYLLIGLVMFLTSGSPLVIRHKRIGRGGLPIVISKYRSMKRDWTDQNGKLSAKFQEYLSQHPDAAQEWKETAKLKDDPRISAIGKLLRATRLDELPQFFDVLRGDLSLVGPRPIIDWELEKFGEKARILFHVRPGITGPWQVAGGNKLPYDERVRLNAHYIENWSLGLDMVILTKTAWLVVAGILGRLIGRGESEEAY